MSKVRVDLPEEEFWRAIKRAFCEILGVTEDALGTQYLKIVTDASHVGGSRPECWCEVDMSKKIRPPASGPYREEPTS